MKKAFTILALTASALAIILAVLPISNLAIIPSIAALIFGVIAFYLSKKTGEPKKIIQFTILLTFVALALSGYKAFFTTTKVANTDVIDAKEIQFEEEAIQELEGLEINDADFEEINTEELDSILTE
jgi:TRAP-type mannitol/chloroaromatic compound transport system permease small subunit